MIGEIISRKQRLWGEEVKVVIKEGLLHIQTLILEFKGESPSEETIQKRIDRHISQIQAHIDFELNRAVEVDILDPPIKEALFWLVKKIRANPDATLAQAETVWNTEMADKIFDFDKLVSKIKATIGNITWDQFKTYVINKKFEGVD